MDDSPFFNASLPVEYVHIKDVSTKRQFLEAQGKPPDPNLGVVRHGDSSARNLLQEVSTLRKKSTHVEEVSLIYTLLDYEKVHKKALIEDEAGRTPHFPNILTAALLEKIKRVSRAKLPFCSQI